MFRPNLPSLMCPVPAGRLWYAGGGGSGGGGYEQGHAGGQIQYAQVSPDLEELSTVTHLRLSAFSHDAGPLPLTTSAYVCPPQPPTAPHRPPQLKGIYLGWPNSIYWCLPSFHFLVIEWKTQIMCLIDQREQISFVGINNSLQLTEPEEPCLFELFDWSCPGKTAALGAPAPGPRVARAGSSVLLLPAICI